MKAGIKCTRLTHYVYLHGFPTYYDCRLSAFRLENERYFKIDLFARVA